MNGIVDDLLELESDKHRALMACDAASYEELVRRQLRLLEVAYDAGAAARERPDELKILSRLIQLNTVLVLNYLSASPLMSETGLLTRSEYTSAGTPDARPASRISVEV
jgi:hypothetical protein